ncbi:prolyl oligopeptidase family serine peptidase [Amycolatopsis magusensis]|uniref:prolyl oligopeptidase family serine peptidase n=1 Tax=Amycolatopsis magusensis TaxID=882444 RepID=UPI0024A8BA92|nr:prolyl oligopeptidase family serine peptidase [Amycolatopsis magusensis]MDI5981898.1 prolyl oligopeptidase family serine peptidase [Amycolatopsis magusensis]
MKPGDLVEELHGHRVADPFRALEDAGHPSTTTWLAAQQQRAEDLLAGLPGRDEFAGLLRGLVAGPTESPVKTRGGRRFRVGRADAADRWRLQVSDEPDAPWRPAVTPGQLDSGAVVRRWTPSPGGRLLAIQVTTGGSENSTPLSVVDIDSGQAVERSPLTRYSPVEWTGDERAYFYVRRHLDGRGTGVYRHEVGRDPATDLRLIGDDDPMTRYHLRLWHDRWLVVGVRHGTARGARLLCADLAAGPELRPVPLAGSSASGVLIDSAGRLLATSTEDAEFGRLLIARPERGGWDRWRELLPEQPPAVLTAVDLAGGPGAERLVALYTVDGYSRVTVHDAETGALVREAVLPGHGTVSAINPTEDPDVLALSYTDWATALSVWLFDTRTGQVHPADPGSAGLRRRIHVHRTTYRSFDGTEVPLTILDSAQGEDADRPKPTVLTCYGGFGISFRPSFQPDGLTWVLAGGAMAIAAVRGGGERGRGWHREGAGVNKLTAIRDLEAAADWLVAEGWTEHRGLALLGGSNGGMVVTSAAVRRPAAYAALAVAGAPLDMVRYERWGLGRAWREEYGSAADPVALASLLSYSPYHNVDPARGPFPAVLFSAGSEDSRVDPVHSRKMAALLQSTMDHSGGGPVLLRVVDGGGHVGGGPDADRLAVDMLAFLAEHTGLVPGAGS